MPQTDTYTEGEQNRRLGPEGFVSKPHSGYRPSTAARHQSWSLPWVAFWAGGFERYGLLAEAIRNLAHPRPPSRALSEVPVVKIA
jgi:hypothetical protein